MVGVRMRRRIFRLFRVLCLGQVELAFVFWETGWMDNEMYIYEYMLMALVIYCS